MKPNIQVWPMERLVPYEKNAKKHPPDQVARIVNSIKAFGWTQPIVIDKHGVIIAGHGRRLAALELGYKEVPVWVRDDLAEDQVKALRLADNRVALSEIDTTLLQEELSKLDFSLEGMFDKKELDFFLADMTELNSDAFVTDLDAEVERQAKETIAKVAEVDSREVKVTHALGFNSIKGADERTLAMFIAAIEDQEGKTGAEAFVAHAKRYLESLSEQEAA